MALRLVIGSGNAGKVAEFRSLLEAEPLDIISARDAGLNLEVAETGASYMQNAIIKANAYCAGSGLPCLADDSGLEVDALDGEPGILSARFGSPLLSDEGRTTLLLDRLRDVEEDRRQARFRCALALVAPDGRIWKAEGACDGVITRTPSGANGFGYDPIFLLPNLNRTMAELTDDEKNSLSHRARAVAALRRLIVTKPLPISEDRGGRVGS